MFRNKLSFFGCRSCEVYSLPGYSRLFALITRCIRRHKSLFLTSVSASPLDRASFGAMPKHTHNYSGVASQILIAYSFAANWYTLVQPTSLVLHAMPSTSGNTITLRYILVPSNLTKTHLDFTLHVQPRVYLYYIQRRTFCCQPRQYSSKGSRLMFVSNGGRNSTVGARQ